MKKKKPTIHYTNQFIPLNNLRYNSDFPNHAYNNSIYTNLVKHEK